MASYTKRNGKWQARLTYNERGMRKSRNKSGFTTRSEAELWVSSVLADSIEFGSVSAPTITLYGYWRQWYETYKKPNLAPKTQRLYEYSAIKIKQYFGNERLASITRFRFQQFLNDFGQNHSKETCTKVAMHIRAAVRSAMDDGLLKKNFTAHTTIIGNDSKDKRLKYLDGAEMWRLIRRCEQSPDVKHISQVMILTALFTGFRLGEVAGLQWSDLDLVNGTLSVSKSYDWLTHDFKPAKNKQSNRVISITPELVENLQRLRTSQHGIANPQNLMFIGSRGTVPTSNGVNHVLRELSAELKLYPVVTFHGLRHTHASYLISQGISIYMISERLGHADYTTTLNIYSHVQREMRTAENDKMDAAFTQPKFGAQAVHRVS